MTDEDGDSHLGRRPHNEDALLLRRDLGLFAVADAHGAQGTAGRIALASLETFFDDATRQASRRWPQARDTSPDSALLKEAIRFANDQVFSWCEQDPRHRGMTTSLVAVLTSQHDAFVAHVGDCRAYLLRDGACTQQTKDHSLLNELLKNHKLSPDEISNFPHKTVIIRALGSKDTVEVDCQHISRQPGDRLLLCSDGLYKVVEASEIAETIRTAPDARTANRHLLELALERGGEDNITALLLSNGSSKSG